MLFKYVQLFFVIYSLVFEVFDKKVFLLKRTGYVNLTYFYKQLLFIFSIFSYLAIQNIIYL